MTLDIYCYGSKPDISPYNIHPTFDISFDVAFASALKLNSHQYCYDAISQGRNAFQCNVMQTSQGPDRFCQVKSHVQTARESHDFNMVFA